MKQSGNEAHPTISDVARHAGVSRATTSRALSNYGVVNSETRAKVLRSAEELGYVPNVLARSMRAGSTQTLGLIIAEVGLSVFDLAMRSVIESASLQGYQVLVTNTNEDLVAERASIRVMLEKQVDGLIVVPSAVVDLEFLSTSDLKGKPVTLLDRSLGSLGIPSVTADNNRGARDAIEHMHSLGHTKIGLIVVTANLEGETGERPRGLISTIHDRVEGYYAEMAESDLPVNPDWVVTRPILSGVCGSDAKLILGDFADGDIDNPMAAFSSLPHVPGHEVVAEVVALGPKARGLDVGQRVVLNPWLSCAPRGISPLCPPCQAGDVNLCWSFTKGEIGPGVHIGVR